MYAGMYVLIKVTDLPMLGGEEGKKRRATEVKRGKSISHGILSEEGHRGNNLQAH